MDHALPTGIEVERLAATMAGSLGVAWVKADPETARQCRIAANAALILYGTLLLQTGRGKAIDVLTDAAQTQRAVLAALPPGVLDEDLLKALYRSAAATELVASVLDSGADDLPSEDDAEF